MPSAYDHTATDQRIAQMMQNLIPVTAFDGKYGLTAAIEARQAYYHTPGVSMAIIDDYKITWASGFGVAEADTNRGVTSTTLFQAASISKPVFALAVMCLVQEGVLDLDVDVNTYLTSWRIPANEDWQPCITLRHLLSHTAGLTVHGFPGYHSREPLPSVIQILNGEAPANTPKVEVNIFPGFQFRYSGGGMTVAQQVVVDVLHKPFAEIMRDLVLAPLGMCDSTYEQPLPADRAEQAATAHPWKGFPLIGKWHCYPKMAAAGLWTTATDLAKVGVELMSVLQEKSTPQLITRHTIETMLSPQLPDQQDGHAQSYFGLGFGCGGTNAGFNFLHSGWNEGFTAQMRFYPNIGKGAVIMANSNEGYPLIDEIMRAIAREYHWPGVFPETKSICPLTQLGGYAGTYLTPTGLPVVVTVNDGQVILQFSQQPPLCIQPTSDIDFLITVLNASVTFEKEHDGQIVALTITQPGKQLRALKQLQNYGD